jgi:anti-anti-sigma factor
MSNEPLKRIFHTERQGDTLIVQPLQSVMGGDLDQADVELRMMVEMLRDPELAHVVIDFAGLSYFGTSMLGGVAMLWKKVSDHHGQLALCNVPQHGREVLRTTRLNKLWQICDTRADALKAVQSGTPTAK